MVKDLVDRLRTQPPRHGPSASTDMLRDEAADKIEQMQREILDRGKIEYALQLQVNSLRKALTDIQTLSVASGAALTFATMSAAHSQIDQITRAALAAR